MDWLQDSELCDEPQLSNVFRYSESTATVVRVVPGSKKPLLWTMNGQSDWDEWFETEHPKPDGSASGLVLIIARESGERATPGVKRVDSGTWLKAMSERKTSNDVLPAYSEEVTSPKSGGQKTLATLPFTKKQFKRIVQQFFVHKSLSRCVSRSDVPALSADEIFMKGGDGEDVLSHVYNCRSSNVWPKDLALTATHFPHCALTYAVMFGCSIATETKIIKRLETATAEAAYPLLLPGIFIELERQRHNNVVQDTIEELERRISEIQFKPEAIETLSTEEKARRIEARKSAWMDTMYLKNQLISWNTLLNALLRHLSELDGTAEWKSSGMNSFPASIEGDVVEGSGAQECSSPLDSATWSSETCTGGARKVVLAQHSQFSREASLHASRGLMERTNRRVQRRIRTIIHEYNETIRDCTMRVEGMTMATQWAQGETNLDIALSTSRESRHMSSIAVVTMIFLPGTFFASIFSMDFFDWRAESGKIVSKYFWIYVVMALMLTLSTLCGWWFFGIHRSSRQRQLASVV